MSWTIAWMVVLLAALSCQKEAEEMKIINFYKSITNLHMVKGETSIIVVEVEKRFDDKVSILLSSSLDASNVVSMKLPTTLTFNQEITSFPLEIEAKLPGVVVVSLNITTEDPSVVIRTGEASHNSLFYRIRVGKFYSAQLLSHLIGWIYVIIWNISSYPQLIKNFRRGSIVGVHLDYLCKI